MSLSLSVVHLPVMQLGLPVLGVASESINSELFILAAAAKCFQLLFYERHLVLFKLCPCLLYVTKSINRNEWGFLFLF